MSKLLIVGTQRYSINMCDFDLAFRKSDHTIVKVLWHTTTRGKGWFKTGKYKPSTRASIVTKLTELPNESWSKQGDLKRKIDALNFDYICLGNGNDGAGRWLQTKYKHKKFLFSEYGWLPWNQCFFIDDKGTGPHSSIRNINFDNIKISRSEEEINYIKHTFNSGNKVEFRNFVYVPLQVDTPMSDGKPDFKFQFTKFRNNLEFLKYIRSIVPKNMKVLVKDHPVSRRRVKFTGTINITDMKLNKFELYNRMEAMMCINSTSAIEGMLFGKKVFTYGNDVYDNCTLQNVDDVERLLNTKDYGILLRNSRKLIDVLLMRQYNRLNCSDTKYIKSHYWNKEL